MRNSRRDGLLWCSCSACQERKAWKRHPEAFSEETLLDIYNATDEDKPAIAALLAERADYLRDVLNRIEQITGGDA